MLTYNQIIKILERSVKSSQHEYEWASQDEKSKKKCCLIAELRGKYVALRCVLEWIEELNGTDKKLKETSMKLKETRGALEEFEALEKEIAEHFTGKSYRIGGTPND